MATGASGGQPSVLSTLPKDLPLDFLKTITDQFSPEHILGTGAFGTVYMGIAPDGQKITVKKLAGNSPIARDKLFTNEVQNIMALHHENVVKLVGYCHEAQKKVVQNNGRYIVADIVESLLCYEYLPQGNLQKNLFDDPENCGFRSLEALRSRTNTDENTKCCWIVVHDNWTDEHIVSQWPHLDRDRFQQIKVCIKIGLECVEIDRQKRPSIEEIVNRLNGLWSTGS
uniref:Protein kinase domain-containing protein n=1 Tax=Triticum aestivum TaxID=4565 RepID=A0A077RPV0_WHEAT|nr:unnamed protein product [Triticum aestivum]